MVGGLMQLVAYNISDVPDESTDISNTIQLIKNGVNIDELYEMNLYYVFFEALKYCYFMLDRDNFDDDIEYEEYIKIHSEENISIRKYIVKQFPIKLPKEIIIDIIELYV